MNLSPSAIASDPNWLPHRYDEEVDAVHFLRLDRSGHRGVTFITDEYLPADAEKIVLRRQDAIAGLKPGAPIHFVFHSAYCCSTLVARALDIEGAAMTLKEPRILNDMIGWKRRGADPARLRQVLGDVLTLLGQPFGPGEALIVKPSNLLNMVGGDMLAMRPDARALLLHAPLPDFLKSIAKKGLWGRLWVRELFISMNDLKAIDLGLGDNDYLDLTDLQIAAAGWLAQHVLFRQLIDRFPERVRSLDSIALLARPEQSIGGLGELFRLDIDAAAVASGPAFNRHSKFDIAFTPEDRVADQRDAGDVHADEIDKVAVWAEAVAAYAGIDIKLPAPLLGTSVQ
jgi:hypothetical protein